MDVHDLTIIRAQETWQQAGAYYVRIQAMAKKHHITLREEFDEHDTPETKYIVVTENDFPIATARMYELDQESVMIGRVVVLPEYRHRGIGTMVVRACEDWASELGFTKSILESRDNKVEFYQKQGYTITGEAEDTGTFRCVRMEKELRTIYIGPFFYIKDSLIHNKCLLSEGRQQADKIDNSYGHDRLWDDHFTRGDYINYPRGRVVWDCTNKHAIIYIDRCIDRPEVLKKIREAFGLTDYVTEYDDHYRCRNCIGELFDD